MARLLDRLRGGHRDITSIDDYIAALNASAADYLGHNFETTLGGKPTKIAPDFRAFAKQGMGSNSVVFSCMLVRQFVFQSARFRFQRYRDGKPADLFGSPALEILDRPWTGGSTEDLLAGMIQHADLAGNAFRILETPLSRLGGDPSGAKEIVTLRPDWVDIVLEPRWRRSGRAGVPDGILGRRKIGYIYTEGGRESGNDPVVLLPDEVAHFMPIPDPLAPWRGMSWLTPIVRELQNDELMTRHKGKFFENGATPNMIIKHVRGADKNQIIAFNKRLQEEHGGTDNAYKTLNLYPGADATVVGNDMKSIDFKNVQGAGETRIAAAAGTPPVIVGLSEGLAAATYSNYAQARRRFGDGTIHPMWGSVASSLETLVGRPGPDTRLWYDADNIPFLREDEKDSAEIAKTRAETINSLITAGYTPESVVQAVEADDFRLLAHTGMFSVQLQRPGVADGANDPAAGSSDGAPAAAADADAPDDQSDADTARNLTEMVQKVYLGVGKVIDTKEARELLNRAGAGLDPDLNPTPTTPPSQEAQA